jgi:hypothetical protein
MGIVVGGPCVASPRLLLAALKSPDKLLSTRRREGAAEWLLVELVGRGCCLSLRVDKFELIGRKIGTLSARESLSLVCVLSS